MTEEEWDDIIDEMIYHLHYMNEEVVVEELERDVPDDWSASYKTVNYILDKHKDAFFELFSKYFYHLWDWGVDMSHFKYILKRNRGSIFTQRDLTWFERMKYRFKGYKVIKVK